MKNIKIGELYRAYREKQLHVYKEPTYKCAFCLKDICESYVLVLADNAKERHGANDFICYVLCTRRTSLIADLDLIKKIS